jgi:hypothetical protein
MTFIEKEHPQLPRFNLLAVVRQEALNFGFFAATSSASTLGLTLLVFFQQMPAASNKS